MTTTPIDPWQLQQALMQASDQRMAERPLLTKEVILYAALNLEEGSETVAGLVKALQRIAGGESQALGAELGAIAQRLEQARALMHEVSLDVRAKLHVIPNDLTAELTREEVIEMADGTTDLTVTNSGFALALGIDGAACYADVNGSNLSKADPATGKIAKTPDGKWIKHPNWHQPNLEQVIFGASAKPAP